MKKVLFGKAIAAIVAGAALTSAHVASAATCASLTNPVYVGGSSASQPLLQQAASFLATATVPVNIVYINEGSCTGLANITTGANATETAVYYPGGTGTATACDLPLGGQPLDIGVSDVFPATCPNITVPANQFDFHGSVQSMEIVTTAGSNQTSISAEAAAMAFGYGGVTYQVAPWTDKTFFYVRGPTSGTQQMTATAIGLNASKWIGTSESGSKGMVSAVGGSTSVNGTLGILVSGSVDTSRATVKGLAYQKKGGTCGYFPDSTVDGFDKINVRTGRYDIWGPIHFVTAVGADAKPASANVAKVIGAFTRDGLTDDQTKAMIIAEAQAYTTPQCAMNVTRTSEIGVPTVYIPAKPCGCLFEETVLKKTSCTACTTDTDCASGAANHCRYGYCEAN